MTKNELLSCLTDRPCEVCKFHTDLGCSKWSCVFEGKTEEWIPCEERLPEEEEKLYWVCTDSGYQCQCRWTNDRWGIGAGIKWGWKLLNIPQYSRVIAWMPLPEPWKGETDDQE